MLREFIVTNGSWLVVAGIVFISLPFIIYQYRGIKNRRRQLQKRSIIPEVDWFRTHFPIQQHHELVRDLLIAIANEIGVNWTQLHPSDTFEETLRVQPRYMPIDDLDGAELEIAMIAEKHHLKHANLPGLEGSLEGFLRRWVDVVSNSTSGIPQ